MAHGKLSPRQKMINMMYLILTALLALNVSKDILEAFVRVNKGLEITNKSFTQQNSRLYSEFENQLAQNEDKVRKYYDAANKARELSQAIYDTIYNLKLELVSIVEGHDMKTPEGMEETKKKVENVALIEKKDNYDDPSRIMNGVDVGPESGRAYDLKVQLESFRDKMIDLIKDENLSIFQREKTLNELGNIGINTADPTEEELSDDEKKDPHAHNWTTRNFYHNVVIATITMLTNLQNDVRNAEYQIVNALLAQIGAADFKFDKIVARCVPKSSYVLQGEQYEADLFVAAYSTTEDPIVTIASAYDTVKDELVGDTMMIPVVNGVGKYKVSAQGSGLKKFAALIQVKKPDGTYAPYVIPETEYRVAPPSAVVSPTKMLVLYRGIDNPISVSAAGMSVEDLQASGSNVTLKLKKAGEYDARPGAGANATITVSAKKDGGSKSMGKCEFRVKDVPSPIAKVAGKTGGTIKRAQLLAQKEVEAVLENFAFDLTFSVINFRVGAKVGSFYYEEATSGSRINSKQMDLLKQLKPGDRAQFEDIKARGPDGKVKELGAVNLKIIP